MRGNDETCASTQSISTSNQSISRFLYFGACFIFLFLDEPNFFWMCAQLSILESKVQFRNIKTSPSGKECLLLFFFSIHFIDVSEKLRWFHDPCKYGSNHFPLSITCEIPVNFPNSVRKKMKRIFVDQIHFCGISQPRIDPNFALFSSSCELYRALTHCG